MPSMTTPVVEGTRSDVLACVEKFPGAHLRGIERLTELPLGQVLYHLDRLERMGIIASQRDAGFRRYYPTASVGRAEKKYLAALRHDATRRIALAVLERGPSPHKELQEHLQIAGSTLSFHLQRLLDAGVLRRERHGAVSRYALVEPDVARRELILYRESFRDPAVDRYVRAQLAQLPGLANVVPVT